MSDGSEYKVLDAKLEALKENIVDRINALDEKLTDRDQSLNVRIGEVRSVAEMVKDVPPRVKKLEDRVEWATRLVLGAVIAAVMGLVVANGTF